jgi:hypothetical protein
MESPKKPTKKSKAATVAKKKPNLPRTPTFFEGVAQIIEQARRFVGRTVDFFVLWSITDIFYGISSTKKESYTEKRIYGSLWGNRQPLHVQLNKKGVSRPSARQKK